jgi:hypothetical protein
VLEWWASCDVAKLDPAMAAFWILGAKKNIFVWKQKIVRRDAQRRLSRTPRDLFRTRVGFFRNLPGIERARIYFRMPLEPSRSKPHFP